MTLHEHPRDRSGFRPPSAGGNRDTSTSAPEEPARDAADTSLRAVPAALFASLRLVTGFVFLWAFLDKTFGLGYSTASGRGWVDGGSPAKGFLGSVAAGPMESTFHDWAGAGWTDWLFMLGLLGVGLAVTAGVALWPAALAGTVLMAMMWLAEWPPAKHLSDGAPSMSSNPFADYHLVYALVLIVLAAVGAGATWGLGRFWTRLPLVRDHVWLH
ncbi:hypothetical protein [Streptomyces sp. NPDC008150]|uniref:hypothetical protein n=1 Tax=Streptomyces sp. NPDC008150 TaxID=3364816 RepID=UPI0036E1CF90